MLRALLDPGWTAASRTSSSTSSMRIASTSRGARRGQGVGGHGADQRRRRAVDEAADDVEWTDDSDGGVLGCARTSANPLLCVLKHSYRIKYFILRNNILVKVRPAAASADAAPLFSSSPPPAPAAAAAPAARPSAPPLRADPRRPAPPTHTQARYLATVPRPRRPPLPHVHRPQGRVLQLVHC